MGPKRIVCLTEETTELLYLLGEEDRIVGISAYTVRPLKAKEEKPRVSAFISGNIRKIKELKPDLVIGFSDIQADLARDLIREGLNVLVTNQRSLEEIFEAIRLVGGLVGKAKESTALIDGYRRKLDNVRKNSSNRSKPKVFFQEWDEPVITGIRWVSELIDIAGGKDCFVDFREKTLAKDRIVSLQDVADADPDIIVGCWCGKPVDFEWVRTRREWQNVSALRNQKIFEMDPAIILQPGPALFEEGLFELEKIMKEFESPETY
ncbi:cobalamin-binding protein [Leptospira fluminis]|uniref:Cobalamin-binding protein n=1 Tax=Leptospira fluminis TaxID=2484979 RepID=A0A4R9GSU9_9LEPT|nr:cobalamin-binding protein [Leptospira fluminis]TGK21201.1 cobalamin-binding protein [Leptospira fluminis]